MRLTDKQIEVLRAIAEGNPDGTVADLDEVIERVRYKPTKQAIQFSIRALVGHDLVEKLAPEKRRGRMRVLLKPTLLGMHFHNVLKPSLSAALSVSEDE